MRIFVYLWTCTLDLWLQGLHFQKHEQFPKNHIWSKKCIAYVHGILHPELHFYNMYSYCEVGTSWGLSFSEKLNRFSFGSWKFMSCTFALSSGSKTAFLITFASCKLYHVCSVFKVGPLQDISFYFLVDHKKPSRRVQMDFFYDWNLNVL